jgi:RHS repeat-associated protein
VEASKTGNWSGPFGYAGGFGYQEDETGLRLLGHRYYDPSTGRFLTRDPIKDGRNWYSYCENNPVMLIDADGLKPGDTFDSPEEAAFDAYDNYFEKSLKEGVEYGGVIYQRPDGKWTYTVAKGSADGIEVYVPKGAKRHRGWHTHPYREGKNYEDPRLLSLPDIEAFERNPEVDYVFTVFGIYEYRIGQKGYEGDDKGRKVQRPKKKKKPSKSNARIGGGGLRKL